MYFLIFCFSRQKSVNNNVQVHDICLHKIKKQKEEASAEEDEKKEEAAPAAEGDTEKKEEEKPAEEGEKKEDEAEKKEEGDAGTFSELIWTKSLSCRPKTPSEVSL